MFSWLWPWIGIVLPLPLLIRRWIRPQPHTPVTLKVPFFNTLDQASGSSRQRTFPLGAWLASLLWLCLVAAAARPVWFGDPVNIATSGRDLMLALDISDSMRIEDMPQQELYITRIQAIKEVASRFIEARAGDRVGLILFGQRSYLMSPLTFDRNSVVEQLQEALPGFAGSSTAIGDAIGKAIEILRDRPVASRVLILMTDGSNTHGSEPAEALDIALEAGIRIHTIGVGGTRVRTVFADGRQMEIDPTRDLDEATLKD
nr:VWA domain-containing protein [Gammaproteobacteria bacterium]